MFARQIPGGKSMDELDEKERLELSARLIARHQSNGSLEAYPTNHLFMLSPRNPLRRFCVFISTSKVSLQNDSFSCCIITCLTWDVLPPVPHGISVFFLLAQIRFSENFPKTSKCMNLFLKDCVDAIRKDSRKYRPFNCSV